MVRSIFNRSVHRCRSRCRSLCHQQAAEDGLKDVIQSSVRAACGPRQLRVRRRPLLLTSLIASTDSSRTRPADQHCVEKSGGIEGKVLVLPALPPLRRCADAPDSASRSANRVRRRPLTPHILNRDRQKFHFTPPPSSPSTAPGAPGSLSLAPGPRGPPRAPGPSPAPARPRPRAPTPPRGPGDLDSASRVREGGRGRGDGRPRRGRGPECTVHYARRRAASGGPFLPSPGSTP